MEAYLNNLFKGSEPWRIGMFIDKMKDLQKDATINEVGQFSKDAIRIATDLMNQKKYGFELCQCTEEPMWPVGGLCVTCNKPQKKK